MTTYYVGPGGNDGNNGTSWALRKLTLNGAEDIPVAANDTVYVAPGTYREMLTVDVSGAVGQPITYIGDYTGANTDGVGGVVRITGSDNDTTKTRNYCIAATSKNYRTFSGFLMDMTVSAVVFHSTAADNIIYENCAILQISASDCIRFNGNPTNNTVRKCLLYGQYANQGVYFVAGVTTSGSNNIVENCLILFTGVPVRIDRVGGITVKNNTLVNGQRGIYVSIALAGGQVVTVNNNVFHLLSTAGITITADGELAENYNTFSACAASITGGTPPAIGANSNTYISPFDTRWFFQMINEGAGPNSASQVISPFDLASYSQLINVAGTSPTATDMRGTAAIGGQREWGALEYDSTLKIEGGGGTVNLLRGKL